MIVFGVILLVPMFNAKFAVLTAGVSSTANTKMDGLTRSGLKSQFLGGVLLGAVWSPCIGPTLGGAISLASQGGNLWWAGAIMTSFAAGISTIILALSYGAREAIRKRQTSLRTLAARSKPIMGIVFVAVGLMIALKLHYIIESWLLNIMPIWLQDLSVVI
jgi:cytochrome c biogenesis protein CcdA